MKATLVKRGRQALAILVDRPDLSFIGKLADHAHAIRQSLQQGIAPTRRKYGGRFLIHFFIRLREKFRMLAGRRRDVFFHGDVKFDIAPFLMLLHGVIRNLRQFIRTIQLRVLPVRHCRSPRALLRPADANQCERRNLRLRSVPSQSSWWMQILPLMRREPWWLFSSYARTRLNRIIGLSGAKALCQASGQNAKTSSIRDAP